MGLIFKIISSKHCTVCYQYHKQQCVNLILLSVEDGLSLPTKATEEFRPFMRQLPEFKFWSVMLCILLLLVSQLTHSLF